MQRFSDIDTSAPSSHCRTGNKTNRKSSKQRRRRQAQERHAHRQPEVGHHHKAHEQFMSNYIHPPHASEWRPPSTESRTGHHHMAYGQFPPNYYHHHHTREWQLQAENRMGHYHPAHEQFISNYYYHHPPCTPIQPLNRHHQTHAHPTSSSHRHPRTPKRSPSTKKNRHQLLSPPKPRRVAFNRQTSPRCPVQSRRTPKLAPVPNSLGLHRIRLPSHLLHILDTIVLGCEAHAITLDGGWATDLYSLTKQDIALREIPALYHAAKPIIKYIHRTMEHIYGVSLRMDRNQPHVLKYDGKHSGVELHHDQCDITANLCLSRTTSYVGGG